MPESDAQKEDGEPVSDEHTLRVPLLPAAVVRQFPLATDLIRAALAPAYGTRSPHCERWLDTATGEYCVRLKNDLKPWAFSAQTYSCLAFPIHRNGSRDPIMRRSSPPQSAHTWKERDSISRADEIPSGSFPQRVARAAAS